MTFKIVGVAIKKDQIVYCLPKPFRHHDVIEMMIKIYGESKPFQNQGFVTEDWRYFDRKTAAEYALYYGQCKKLISPPRLYSEDLW